MEIVAVIFTADSLENVDCIMSYQRHNCCVI